MENAKAKGKQDGQEKDKSDRNRKQNKNKTVLDKKQQHDEGDRKLPKQENQTNQTADTSWTRV